MNQDSLRNALHKLQQQRIPAIRENVIAPNVIRTNIPETVSQHPNAWETLSTTNRSLGLQTIGSRFLHSDHVMRNTMSSRRRYDSQKAESVVAVSKVPPQRVEEIIHRLCTPHRTLPTPQPPPCEGASKALRADFCARHSSSAPPRQVIPNDEFSKHYFESAVHHAKVAAQLRDTNDLLAHKRMHDSIDGGKKLTADDMNALNRRLKEESIAHKEFELTRLSDKYVDRIRKQGLTPKPGSARCRKRK